MLIQLPPVQTWLVSKVTSRLSHQLHTTITVQRVDFSLFNKMVLEGTLVEDQHRDTILYAGALKVNITDWWFFKDKTELQYIGLEDATIRLHRRDSVWNYQFIVDYFSSSSQPVTVQKDTTEHPVELDLKRLDLARIHFEKKDEWRGEDMDLRLQALYLNADTMSFTQKLARINALTFTRPDFTLTNYRGRRPAPPDTTFILDPLHLRLNPAGWDLTAGKVSITNGSFRNEKREDTLPNKHFDGNHIYFHTVNTSFTNLRLRQDTITAQFQLATKERSGFEVKKLSARIKWYPEAMEFHRLDLQTGKSHLRNYFAMRFRTLDDMSDFETRIRMEADFADADIDSDDISYFAPELKDWKKHLRISGVVKGTVSDLEGKNAVVQAGKSTLLKGNFKLKGLPDIDKTFIDLQSSEFSTTYEDMKMLAPEIATIEQPRLDRIEWLRFKGNFTGYIRDFVTNGTIETNLGSLNANVNMKLLEYGPSVYSGIISTDNFQLGPFLDNNDMGKISFQGKVIGAGLKAGTLNASLNGTINSLEFNHYTYQHIQINGAVAKRKFNGELVSGDPSLDARLNGLIDFSQEHPKFDFTAQVAKADLTKLQFVRQQVEFNGKFRCNFTGDNIDNFLGRASIYDASVFKNGQRVSFDSLSVESSIVDNNKTITVVSNEFDGAIVGEFSIKDLPASFQTFLNKYYPSYIKPAKSIPINQNFSFVITTKKVDEYIDLFGKDLKGFNNAGVSGRINTKDNLLDLNVDLPNFGYKNISFDNLSLKGRGNLDSLSMETTIGDVHLNDSLHFPGTRLHLRSSNDLSNVQVTTSANQTLNSANLSADVQTLPTGVRVKFLPSTFDINSKTWTIDKDGELSFSNQIISADGLTIHNGEQQVQVTTSPSDEGSWNDVHIDLKKINIGDFTPYFVKSQRIEGLLSGSVDMIDPFGKPAAHFRGEAEQFRFENDSIGRLELNADYQKSTGMLNTLAHSDNKSYHFDIKGLIHTRDSLEGPPLDIIADVSDTKVDLLEKYLGGVFTNLTGNATGKLRIVGQGDDLQYLGTVQLKDASLKVAYTQCTYKIPSATIQFKKDTIDFGQFQLKDKQGRTANLSRGRLFHHSFDDLAFDFELSTNRLLLLDTKATDNSQFYGSVIGKARVTLTGPEEDMRMYIKGEPTDSSNIYLPPSVVREKGEADFIEWKVYGKEMKNQTADKKSSNLLVSLDMYANNYANVYVIIDPLSGDIIKANGHGSLALEVGTNQDLTLKGRYEIDRGNYNFTFQSFIHKPFILKEGVGNYIQWSGNPYDANIGITATYRAENVRFSDLGLSAASGVVISSENVKRYTGDIIVTATLSNKLMSPKIDFQIDLPPGSTLKNDPEALALLQKIQGDVNELNKQVSCLVVLNTFVPLSSSTSAFDAPGAATRVVFNSISGIVSNYFSRWGYNLLRKIFRDNSLRVNFNTSFYNGTAIADVDQSRLTPDRTNLNLSVAKSFMQEKLTLTLGSAFDIGMGAAQVQAASFQFLPDITAEYKITPDGRVVLSFFYRDSYNYLSGNHTQNSSGASISYRRDFDRIDELFKKKKKTPRIPRKDRKPADATEGNTTTAKDSSGNTQPE
ncbi:translocation/assembly module TamB domain-containing protein [Flavitalea sp. BT771]|uniref:translocation/assembly module TamB domain-containing protein n=1 Tax=Flavitalea sp. BT771 TaxID=3063329 RepID=UPI0026E1B5D5|nr:translocation/assembly module TamB domain-containing protein [Flavitalea sp. BT771]MDO6430982.1 translocation/assembly module TamB domain-containing protein [Flavitalea sp. BT771]MDV6219889.1 translocation/assembly module TamB domain-containing protein [Flavitalea sp. BT771]